MVQGMGRSEIALASKTILLDAPPYWHYSGDVILQVKNNGVEYQFCVHQHILSLHSPVWKDMFHLGRESEQCLAQDSLPVVPLEDPLKDVCALIWAFYYGLDDFYESTDLKESLGLSAFGEDIDDIRETTDLDITLGLMRLSHKYQADKIYKVVVKLLLESWSLNREEYFAKDQSERERIASSIGVIRAARITNCSALLPTAFYELATIPMEQWTADGANKLSLLSSEDLGCLFLGKSRIYLRYKRCFDKLLEEYRAGGISEYGDAHCCNRRQILLRLQAQLGSRFLDGTPNFEKPFALRSLVDLGVKNCTTCENWIFGLLRELEDNIWKSLPVEFNLPAVDVEYTMPRKRRTFL